MRAETKEDFRYLQLAAGLQRQIEQGVYRVGEKLPSVRKLRAERGLSMTTVSRALAELEMRGLVSAKPRSGYFVTPNVSPLPTPSLRSHRVQLRKVPLPHLADDFVTASADRALVPLGGAVLSPKLLPLKQLARIVRQQVSNGERALARYGPPAGAPELRRQIARRLGLLGLAVGIDDIVVSNGCMDAIRLALQAVCVPGDVVALESPTFFGFLQLVRDMGLLALEVPTHPRHGIDVETLDRSLAQHKAKALVVTPSFQNPTGALISDDNKRTLAAICSKHGVTIVEDDVYGDLPHLPQRPAPLAALHSGDIIYCSSFSKTLAPGLRIGFMVPGKHLARVRRLKLSGTITSPALNQLVLADFLNSGAYDRHLRSLRSKIARQVAAARHDLARHLPAGSEVTVPDGGFLLWARLPKNIDAMALHEALRARGISILPGPLCSSGGRYRDHIRINCGYPWGASMTQACATLGEACRTLGAS